MKFCLEFNCLPREKRMRRGSNKWKLHLQSYDWRSTFCSIPISTNRNILILHIKKVAGRTTLLVYFNADKFHSLKRSNLLYAVGSELTLAIQTQLLKIPLMWTEGFPQSRDSVLQAAPHNSAATTAETQKHLPLILLRLCLTTRWYHCKCIRRIFLKKLF